MSDITLTVQAGEPFAQQIRIRDGQNVWASLGDFEVRAQVRQYRSTTSDLVVDLTPFLTVSLDANDILITLSLTGAETRAIRGGQYDVIVSDIGTTDARAVVLIYGTVEVSPVVTSAS
jgi:hypothetical protein